jgi:hypothetical protein
MSVIKLSPVVASIADVIAIFDRIMIYRSGYGAGGPFSPITTPATAIPLVAGQITYAYEDLNGDESYYYCVQYINTQTGAVSGFSTPQLGSGSAAESIISVDAVKTNYFFGLDLTDPNGVELADSVYSFYISSAVATVEKLLDIPLTTKVITNEKHDYTKLQRNSHGWIQLDNHIIQQVNAVRVQYPGQTVGTALPPEWIVCDQDRGSLQILPVGSAPGQASFGITGSYGGLLATSYLPSFYSVDYTCGFLPGKCPGDLADIVGMQASLPVLMILGDLIGGAGISASSIGIDGLSQQISTTSSPSLSGYGARVKLYNDALQSKIAVARNFYAGMALCVS